MPKYRHLDQEELHALKSEFIDYLVVNGIVAEDWEKLKADDPAKASEVVDLFSDVVFEGVMRKVEFLEHRSKQEVRTFQCLADKMILMALKVPGEEVDFTDPEYFEQAMTNSPEGMEVYTAEKAYNQPRELELFQMTEAGCRITDGKLFKSLCLAMADGK